MRKLLAAARAVLHEDELVAWLVAAFALLQLIAAGWDLPGAYGWENDGIAPRDLFGGLAESYAPRHGHRYPPLHYLLLATASLPVLAYAVIRAGRLDPGAVEASVLSVEVMTGISVAAKLIAVAFASIALIVLARIARRLTTREVGRWTTTLAMTSLSFSYYARTSNLDVPYLAWTVLALDGLLSVRERGALRDYVWLGVLAAASVATKDQAYASYVLVGLLYLVALPWYEPEQLAAGAKHFKHLLLGIGAGALALGVLGGGLINPTGFLVRLELLSGTNSQDWRTYERSLTGLISNIRALWSGQANMLWPWPIVACAWVGVALAATPAKGGRAAAIWRLMPLAAGLSSIAFFTLVVGRSSHRFALVLGFMLAFYAAITCVTLVERARAVGLRSAASLALALAIGSAALRCAALVATQWADARQQIEASLLALPPGSVVEAYGPLVYQPHFDTTVRSPYRLRYVDSARTMRGLPSVRAEIPDAVTRKPEAIVITEGYASRFLTQAGPLGHTLSNQERAAQRDERTAAFIVSATRDELPGYRVTTVARPELPGWLRALGQEPQRIHGSTGGTVWLLTRQATASARPYGLKRKRVYQGRSRF